MVAPKFKVCYLIFSSTPRAGGGHFHSLKTTIEALSDQIGYKVFNAGLVLGKPLQNFDHTTFIPLGRQNVLTGMISLYREVKSYSPSVIHAFDLKSLWLGRLIGYWLRIPVVFTKCGGKNGSQFIPAADEYILFSGENLAHYRQYQTAGGPLHLIPNRAKVVPQDVDRVVKLKDKLNLHDRFVILRVSRVTRYYHDTYRQSVALLKSYLEAKPTAVLLFVGFVQDKEFLSELVEEFQGLPVHFVTDPFFCRDAAQLLSVADAVVATGRGVMEAASVVPLVYAPNADSELPSLLTMESLPQLLHYNFSERAKGILPRKITEADPQLSQAETSRIFTEHFDIVSAVPKFLGIYGAVDIQKPAVVNFISHGLRFLKGLR